MTQVLPIHNGANTTATPSLGQLIVLTGPSGVGKGTLLKILLERYPQLHYSVSATTRSPRPGEINGKNYHFITRDEFEELITQGEFLEWAEFAGNYYGTLRNSVLHDIQEGKLVVLEIELEGARQIRKVFPNALRIFILPPSLLELEKRIRGRGQDTQEAIASRLNRAKEEIAAAAEFDLKIINDDLETALSEIEKAIFKEIS
ncbi:guanylate kinase [Anabaena sp. FACHB-1237]|uniref:guanylate kinase n=1 Tax=Anabaena sp. FACHB-1237 TaxID=2692769 RepID=UPI0016809718|nr:guanylate kinase [Anabaena sp. FACHB-1237]MBD2137152.1 guanylate kinase [Anabaena sp. FACHB-1237]